ncbi:hypothetical protein F2Q68_00008546 [Brassica cretica]|uniref:Uncharacterized protein n=1 Tax=Brassica cretica TaxID=69181 RepID=A0A8S9KTZ9_BRACR|nr:hypothetical protein F2Q68_00008546 [Brassica cretica]
MFFLLNLPKVNFVILMGFNNLILVAETKYFRASLADTGGRAKHQNDGISMTTPADAPKQHNTDFDKAYNQHLFGLILAVLLRQGVSIDGVAKAVYGQKYHPGGNFPISQSI